MDDRRGAHLALSVERLAALVKCPLQRIGLSATQKPIEEVARFLVGTRAVDKAGDPDCEIIDIGHRRELNLAIEMPKSPLEAVMSNEVWEEVYGRLAELIQAHRTTLVFVNTRRMRAGRSFGMILDTEDRQFLVAHSLDCAVVQVDVSYFNLGGERRRIHRETVILRGDGYFARAQVFDRLIGAAMAKFQFECRAAKSEPKNLMTKTNPEDWFLAHQIVHGFVCVSERRWVAWTVRKKNPVGIEGQHFFSRCASRHDGYLKAFLPEQAQNIFFYTVVICGNSGLDRR